MARMNVPPHATGRLRRLAAGALVVALAATVGGCGWRAETEPPTWPSPDPITLERDAAALREYQVTAQLGEITAGTAYSVTLSSLETRFASAHLEALGGVYFAYPEDEILVLEQSLERAVREARDGALNVAVHTDDADLAALLCSIGLSHALALWYSSVTGAQYAGVEILPGAEHELPEIPGVEDAPLVPNTTELEAQEIMELAVAHDQARYLYETIAARSIGAERAVALARWEIHLERARALVALSGVEDQRDAVYSLTAASVTGTEAQAATARAMEQSIGARYASAAGAAARTDRLWLVNAAFEAYAASALLPGFIVEEFPVFPGVTVDLPAE
jgi:hypothetical protein